MRTRFCLILGIFLSVFSFYAKAQGEIEAYPFCQQLVGEGDKAVKLSIEVLDDESLRLTITRAYAQNLQENPQFNFSTDWMVWNPRSNRSVSIAIVAGQKGVSSQNLSNGQSVTIPPTHELIEYLSNDFTLRFVQIPYKLGNEESVISSGYLNEFYYDPSIMQCASTTVSITSDTKLESLCVGSEITLNAEGFSGSGAFVWQRASNPEGPWNVIEGQNNANIKIITNYGSEYFKVSRGDEETDPFAVTSVPCCQYTDDERQIWKEDFGTVPRGTRACYEYVKNHTCNVIPSTEIPDGQYAVVSNSDDALDLDGIIYSWARNKTDHTGNPNGGFLVINIGAPCLIYEQEITRDFCENQWYTFSLFACNISQEAGHQATEFRFEVTTPEGEVLGQGETGPILDWLMESWTNYGVSFNSGNHKTFIIRLYSVAGNANGNDVVIDDMSISVCSPQIDLYADIDAGLTDATVDCGSDLELAITANEDYLYSIYSTPYILWQKSTDEGATWTSLDGSGEMVTKMQVTKEDPAVTDYYRCILAGSKELAEEAATTGTLQEDCQVYSITNMIRIDCKLDCSVSLQVSPDTICVGDEITINAIPSSYDTYYWEGNGVAGNGSSQTVTITEKSSYTVYATSPGCVTQPFSLEITPYERPIATLSASSNEICEGEEISLTASAPNADKYDFYVNNEILVSQEQSELQTIPANGNNEYKVIAYNHGCEGLPVETQVTAHDAIKLAISPADTLVCINSEVELEADVLSGEASVFFWNGVEKPNPSKFIANSNASYEVYAQNDFCTSEPVKIKLNVEDSVKVSLPAIDDICFGETINITANITGEYDAIKWYEMADGEAFIEIAGTTGEELSHAPQKGGNTTYRVDVSATACPGATSQTSVSVHDPILIEISPADTSVCENSALELDIITLSGEPSRFFWNGIEGNNNLQTIALENMQYEVYAENDYCTSNNATATINVEDSVKVSLQDATEICAGEQLSLYAEPTGNYTELRWYESLAGGNFELLHGENGTVLNLTPESGSSYMVEAIATVCPPSTDKTTVNVNPLPEILQISDNAAAQGVVSVVVSDGTPPYSYYLNDEAFGSDPTFTNLDLGTHYEIIVEDAKGCSAYGTFDTPVLPINIPPYFSPNGDGIHDTWEIENLNMYPSAAIEIYDRHGRRIVSYTGSDIGWDGTYNGHEMPMSDYWYIITIPEQGIRLNGHFILKR